MIVEMDEDASVREATLAFEREVGVTGVKTNRVQTGNRTFLKFTVGRDSPLYTFALLECQRTLSETNALRGAMGLTIEPAQSFPESIEANALLTLLARSTREVSQGTSSRGYTVPYIPFQNREDHQLAQPASHIVHGRRGVGKSTLIKRAVENLAETSAVVAILDMQAYSTLSGEDLIREVLYDSCMAVSKSSREVARRLGVPLSSEKLDEVAANILDGEIPVARAPATMKRELGKITQATQGNVFLFLDDFHVIEHDDQPSLLHSLHAATKGANGWLKVAGLSSLLNAYTQQSRKGLQVPGDAQCISLDLTLENPEAAETHLHAILNAFLKAVGYPSSSAAIPDAAFRRLAWANAGVPRDFLQMFGRSLEHAQKNRHSTITLSDVNIAIGEFGQQKMDDLQRDARNEAGILRDMLAKLEKFCIDDHQVNAFLIRSGDSREKKLVETLSDLRLVHLIHRSITPDRAGERYEAFILDYSIFTGFRRRPNVREMIPDRDQFKAAELRALPKVNEGFLMLTQA